MRQMRISYRDNTLNVSSVMLDVIIVLLPLLALGGIAYGLAAVTTIGATLLGCVASELIFSRVFLGKSNTLKDGSALITGLLLAFTISPLTPWYVAVFGGAMAILFGKILWGGLGKNRLNPALVGREFMVVFFPVWMAGKEIWNTSDYLQVSKSDLFPVNPEKTLSGYFTDFLYNPTGAIGEYSAVLILLGGLYLLCRRRISWHIPFFAITTLVLIQWLLPEGISVKYSTGGLLIGILFMATDMPSSPSYSSAKAYYAILLSVVVVTLILGGVQFAYMSYSILIMNAFSQKISSVFRPDPWGTPTNWKPKAEPAFMLTIQILTTALALISVEYYHLTPYILYLYILYLSVKFIRQHQHKLQNPL